MKTLTEINLEKSRSGVYKDNPENRRLHRVGQRYGAPAKDDHSASKPSGEAPVKEEGKKPKIKVNSDIKIGGSLLDYHSPEEFDTAKNGSHITLWQDGKIVNSIERTGGKWISKTSSGEKELTSSEVIDLYMKYKDREEGRSTSFYMNFKPTSTVKKPQQKTSSEQRKKDLERVKAMTDDELASIALGYDAEKHAKADAAHKQAKEAFKKKWGDGLTSAVSKISSIEDVKELLRDSQELGEKLGQAQRSSPYTSETLQALRRRINNKLKKGEPLDDMNIGNFAVEHERSFWKENDFLARDAERFAEAFQKDLDSGPTSMGELYWAESAYNKATDKDLKAKDFNRLVNIVAEHQNRKPRQMRGESTIGGYEDFKRVMSNLDTEDGGESKVKEKEGSRGEKETFTRVNFSDIPNAHKVNLKKYLSAKRKKAVDEAWSKAKFDSVSREKAGVFQESYNKLREQFNNNFDSMSKAERAELLYRILKLKNAMEKK